jgi:hypothetical protein
MVNPDHYADTRYVYQEEREYLRTDKKNGDYYIGTCFYETNNVNNRILVDNTISAITFYKFSFQLVMNYLIKYSIVSRRSRNLKKLHVIQLCILNDESYLAVIKTYWIRLIQRHWKKIYANRQHIIRMRCSIYSMHYARVHGKYPIEVRYLPSIYGLLIAYGGK